MRRFSTSLRTRPRARVFALDHEVVQVDWADLPGAVTVEIDGRSVIDDPAPGPGARTVAISGPTRVVVRAAGAGTLLDEVVRPLAPPPGEQLARLATISDLHFGSKGFDHDERMVEVPTPEQPHWMRCTDAALAEIEAWGAERVVIKGDLTHGGEREAWDLVGKTFATTPLPLHVVPGNHDTHPRVGRIDPYTATDPDVLPMTRWVDHVDLPGLRVVLCNTTIPHRGRGRLAHLLPDLCDRAADARRDGRAVLVAGHHQVNPAPFPIYWPIGVARDEGTAVLAAVRRANPRALYVAGHTHRHRRRLVGGVPHVEVGSPKDHPGVWAGYAVWESGIVQTVRRVERPDCLRWTEQTRHAALGTWGHWSPGFLDDRCFALRWLEQAGWGR